MTNTVVATEMASPSSQSLDSGDVRAALPAVVRKRSIDQEASTPNSKRFKMEESGSDDEESPFDYESEQDEVVSLNRLGLHSSNRAASTATTQVEVLDAKVLDESSFNGIMAAHVLYDTAAAGLASDLCNRLRTIGINALHTRPSENEEDSTNESGSDNDAALKRRLLRSGTLKIEIRNLPLPSQYSPSPPTCCLPPSTMLERLTHQSGFALTLTGAVTVNIGSLFNMLVYNFCKRNPQILNVHRFVRFVGGVPTATRSVNECADSEPIMQLKVAHLAKLMRESYATVVYSGDELSSNNRPASTQPPPQSSSSSLSSASTTAASSASTSVNSATSTEGESSGSAPRYVLPSRSVYPPVMLHECYKSGMVQHFVTDSNDGIFTAIGIDGDAISELYGNRYKETCLSCQQSHWNNDDVEFIKRLNKSGGGAVAVQQSMINARQSKSTLDPHLTGRSCSACGGMLRDCIYDASSLPRLTLQRAFHESKKASLAIVVGHSLSDSPLANMPEMASTSTNMPAAPIKTAPLSLRPFNQSTTRSVPSPIIIINTDATPKDVKALESGGILIRGKCENVLARLQDELKMLNDTQGERPSMEERQLQASKMQLLSSLRQSSGNAPPVPAPPPFIITSHSPLVMPLSNSLFPHHTDTSSTTTQTQISTQFNPALQRSPPRSHHHYISRDDSDTGSSQRQQAIPRDGGKRRHSFSSVESNSASLTASTMAFSSDPVASAHRAAALFDSNNSGSFASNESNSHPSSSSATSTSSSATTFGYSSSTISIAAPHFASDHYYPRQPEASHTQLTSRVDHAHSAESDSQSDQLHSSVSSGVGVTGIGLGDGDHGNAHHRLYLDTPHNNDDGFPMPSLTQPQSSSSLFDPATPFHSAIFASDMAGPFSPTISSVF